MGTKTLDKLDDSKNFQGGIGIEKVTKHRIYSSLIKKSTQTSKDQKVYGSKVKDPKRNETSLKVLLGNIGISYPLHTTEIPILTSWSNTCL